VPTIDIVYLNGPDVAALALTDDEILSAVEGALRAQGLGKTVLEPRVHLVPESSAKGHLNVLRGVVGPLGAAGVKVVGDFVDNWQLGLPSELAVLNLFWHRGLALSDIALGCAMLDKARRLGVGQTLRFQ
jgi:ornithine cyclodeaminase